MHIAVSICADGCYHMQLGNHSYCLNRGEAQRVVDGMQALLNNQETPCHSSATPQGRS